MDSLGSLSRHDLSLVAIALPLVVALLFGVVSPVEMVAALAAASVPATGGLGYALFYNPPTS
jgi:hypothetical protein